MGRRLRAESEGGQGVGRSEEGDGGEASQGSGDDGRSVRKKWREPREAAWLEPQEWCGGGAIRGWEAGARAKESV